MEQRRHECSQPYDKPDLMNVFVSKEELVCLEVCLVLSSLCNKRYYLSSPIFLVVFVKAYSVMEMARVKVWPEKISLFPVYVMLVCNVFLTGVFQNRFLANPLLFRKSLQMKKKSYGTAAHRNTAQLSAGEGGRFSISKGKSMISSAFSTSEKM